MAVLRITGVVLVGVVGLAFVAFGVDDVLMTRLPPMHQVFAERSGLAATPPLVAMVLAVFAGKAGFFFASGLALLLLAAGPVRRGDPFVSAAALALIVFGNAGIVLRLHRVGAPFRLLVALLVLGVVGVAACWGARRRLASGSR